MSFSRIRNDADVARSVAVADAFGANTGDAFVSSLTVEPEGMIAWGRIAKLFAVCIVLIAVSAVLAYSECQRTRHPDCKPREGERPLQTFWRWINGSETGLANVLVGMASGVVFGFVDNAGLFMGMEILDDLFRKLPFGNEEKPRSGYGNTFSDLIGAFLSTFIGRYIEYTTKITEYPMWSEAVGMFVGCLFGIFVPRALLGPGEDEGS